MATKNVSTKPVDLTQCDLPGGQRAYFYTPGQLSVRRERELDVMLSYLSPKLQSLATASTVMVGGEVVATDDLPGASLDLTLDDHRKLFELNDLAAWTFLKSWTLHVEGAALPLPPTADKLPDWVPKDTYLALVSHAGKILANKGETPDQFSIDAIEDPESPTEA